MFVLHMRPLLLVIQIISGVMFTQNDPCMDLREHCSIRGSGIPWKTRRATKLTLYCVSYVIAKPGRGLQRQAGWVVFSIAVLH